MSEWDEVEYWQRELEKADPEEPGELEWLGQQLYAAQQRERERNLAGWREPRHQEEGGGGLSWLFIALIMLGAAILGSLGGVLSH